jgi:hypothetical protein
MKMSKTSIVKIILSEHTAIVKPWKTTTLDRVLRHQFDINVQTFLCQWVFYLQFSWKNANSKHQRPCSFRGVVLTSCFSSKFREISQVQRDITPTKFRRSKFPGNMHNYIWCPYYLPSFMKFCSVVSEELRWQAASVVNLGNF